MPTMRPLSNRRTSPPPKSHTRSHFTPPNYQLTNQEIFELVHHHDQFVIIVNQLIAVSQRTINDNEASDSIHYLSEAQKILQYAASCGKNIDRQLIMAVLHNQAYAYQRMWQLLKCSNYLEALIYNINQKMNQTPSQSSSSTLKAIDGGERSDYNNESTMMCMGPRGTINSNNSHQKSMRLSFGEKVRLIKYHLQFSAVNSQMKNHTKSVKSGMMALKYIKQLLSFGQKNSKLSCELNYPIPNNGTLNASFLKLMIDNLLSINDTPNTKLYQSYLKVCKHLYSVWLKRVDNHSYEVQEEIKNITIGNIMQIKSFTNQMRESQQTKFKDQNYLIESSEHSLNFDRVVYFIILMCISYFTLSTELRLQSFTKLKMDERNAASKWKNECQRSQISIRAEIYHLLCLSVYFIYVPFKLEFFEHILNSYQNHYSGDFACGFEQVSSALHIDPRIRTQRNRNHEFMDVLELIDPLNVSNWTYQHRYPINSDSYNLGSSPSKSKSKKKPPKSHKKSKNIQNESSLKISSKQQSKDPQQNVNKIQTPRKNLRIFTHRFRENRRSSERDSQKMWQKRSLNSSSKKKANSFQGHNWKSHKSTANRQIFKKQNIYQGFLGGLLKVNDEEKNIEIIKEQNKEKETKSKKKITNKIKSKDSLKRSSKKGLGGIKKVVREEKQEIFCPARVYYQLEQNFRPKVQIKKSKQLTPRKNFRIHTNNK